MTDKRFFDKAERYVSLHNGLLELETQRRDIVKRIGRRESVLGEPLADFAFLRLGWSFTKLLPGLKRLDHDLMLHEGRELLIIRTDIAPPSDFEGAHAKNPGGPWGHYFYFTPSIGRGGLVVDPYAGGGSLTFATERHSYVYDRPRDPDEGCLNGHIDKFSTAPNLMWALFKTFDEMSAMPDTLDGAAWKNTVEICVGNKAVNAWLARTGRLHTLAQLQKLWTKPPSGG